MRGLVGPLEVRACRIVLSVDDNVVKRALAAATLGNTNLQGGRSGGCGTGVIESNKLLTGSDASRFALPFTCVACHQVRTHACRTE